MGQLNSRQKISTNKEIIHQSKEVNISLTAPACPKHFEPFVSVSWEPLHKDLYEKVFKLILDKGLFYDNEELKSPYKFKTPEELAALIDFTLGYEGTDEETLFNLLEKIIRYSPHHSHPFYLDKYSAGLNSFAIAGDILGTVLSSPAVTYFFGPVFTLMEEQVKKRLRELIGYSGGMGDGIICPGSGFASVMALRLALHKKYPLLKANGYFGIGNPKICIFISEHATMVFRKAAFIDGKLFCDKNAVMLEDFNSTIVVLLNFSGIGEKACIDAKGRMSLTSLQFKFEIAKAEGISPLLVVATAGTASLGAIDQIQEIANFTKENDLWLHVDADYAGPYLLSDQHKHRLSGIEQSDSVSWSGTGILGSTYCNNFVLTRHKNLFQETFGTSAKYLFTKTDLYDPAWDNGDRTLQTTRRADILKLWLMWKAMGRNGLAQHVDYIHNMSLLFTTEIRNRGNAFQLILDEHNSTKVSFYYVPIILRDFDRHKDKFNEIMKILTKKLKARLLWKGFMDIGISSLPAFPDFFTISITNSALKENHISQILDLIEQCGEEIVNMKSAALVSFPIHEAEKFEKPLQSGTILTSFASSSSPMKDFHKTFFEKIFKLVSEKAIYFQNKREETPYRFRHPEALLQEFDFELRDEPGANDEDEVIGIMDKVIYYSTLQAHPYFVVQLLSAGMDPYGIMAEFVMASQPSSMLTYEHAPVYSLMEKEVFQKVREIIGFPNGEGDGTLTPGGSIGVITALYTAISSKYPELRKHGLAHPGIGKNLVVYLSENGHYCFKKGSLLQGIGIDHCVMIKSDDKGKMIVRELEMAIKKTLAEGDAPLLVGATSGTTVIGSFDSLQEIADVCEKYGLWLHSDASLGGSVMMSETKRNAYLKGVEKVDSINFNTHKLFGIPLEASILVFKRKGILRKTFGTDDPSNFPSSGLYCPIKYDMSGFGGIQTDRRPNIVKFWFMWKAKGIKGMGQHVDYAYDIKDYAVKQLRMRSEAFQMWKPDFEFPAVCFLYIPQKLRSLDRNSEDFLTRINEVTTVLRNELLLKTSVIIGTMKDLDSPLLLKMVLMSSGLVNADIDYMLDQIDLHGRDLDI